MRILDLGEAGYEGQTEAQQHHFYIEGDYDQDRGITDRDCEEITKQLRGMGLQAHCQPDETRQGVVQIDTYSGRTTVQDGLEKAGYEADYVPSPVNMAIEQAISESPKFTKQDFLDNEDKNYHTENGVELAKAFGTPDEIKHMEQIAKSHYTRGHILPDEIEARNVIVSKYYPSLESQEEAMSKMEGKLEPGDLELLKPMVNMKPDVLKMYAKNIIKKYPHLADNVKAMLPVKESSSPWTSSGKHPEVMDREELEHEIDIFKQQQQIQQHLSPGEIAQLDSLYYYLEQLDDRGLDERELTKGEEDRKEDIVKGMKKNKSDFKKRYGDEAEAVMYATATKMAKNEDVNEDIEDETKIIRLKMMQQQVEDLKSNFEILTRLDQRGTGAGDLQDQITTMYKAIESLEGVLGRSMKIVPEETEMNEFDIKKNFQNIANKVKSGLSNVVNPSKAGDGTLYGNMKNKKNFGKGSIAQKINWGGKYESVKKEAVGEFAKPIYDLIDELGDTDQNHANVLHDLIRYLDGDTIKDFVDEFRRVNDYGDGMKYESEDINELDTFAPKTDYIKGPGGEYYKIEYRNNSGMTGKGKDDKARFISINPADDKEITALDLDSMIAKGDADIHQGHDHQGGTPFSDRNIKVYAYGGDDYEEEVPNNAKMQLIKVMTTEAEKKKKAELGTKIRSWRETKADMKKKIEASKPGDKK